MPVPQQLPQIPILWTRYPDARKAIFQHELQQKSGILAVGLRLPDSLGLDLRRIADPQLETKLCQQPLEPACISGSLHAYSHTDSSMLQVPIESPMRRMCSEMVPSSSNRPPGTRRAIRSCI